MLLSPAASVSQGEPETIAMDEGQASAGARSARTSLLHPWKALVAPPLSPSMQTESERADEPSLPLPPTAGGLRAGVDAVVSRLKLPAHDLRTATADSDAGARLARVGSGLVYRVDAK